MPICRAILRKEGKIHGWIGHGRKGAATECGDQDDVLSIDRLGVDTGVRNVVEACRQRGMGRKRDELSPVGPFSREQSSAEEDRVFIALFWSIISRYALRWCKRSAEAVRWSGFRRRRWATRVVRCGRGWEAVRGLSSANRVATGFGTVRAACGVDPVCEADGRRGRPRRSKTWQHHPTSSRRSVTKM